MKAWATHRHLIELAGGFAAVVLVVASVWFFVQRSDHDGTAAPQSSPSATAAPATSPATMTVTIYFHKGSSADPAKFAAVRRTVAKSTMVATASLTELLAGPTSAERDAGFWSVFSGRTAGALRSVRIGNGVGHADFRDLSGAVANSSTSSAVLLSELDATLKQFGSVRTTVYSFGGHVQPFYEWLQMAPPAGLRPGLVQARTVARDFLIRIGGMDKPSYVASRYISDALAAVDFQPTITGRVSGSVTTVLLGYGVTGFTPLSATTDSIAVDSPLATLDPSDLVPVSTPLTITGQAQAWEGHVTLRVLQDNGLVVRRLGEGYGIGGGDQMRPFASTVAFARPSCSTGWLVASELSARNGDVAKATVVPLAFTGAPLRPRLTHLSYATVPVLPEFSPGDPMAGIPADGWAWPIASGTITFTMAANAGTSRVQLFLTPLGSGSAATPVLMGTAAKSGSAFTYAWRYLDEPLLATVTIVATGPAGRSEQVAFSLFHR